MNNNNRPMYNLSPIVNTGINGTTLLISMLMSFVVAFIIGMTYAQLNEVQNTIPKSSATFQVFQYADKGFTIDVMKGEIVAIGLGDKLSDIYGCDYLYPSNIGHTCGNVDTASMKQLLADNNINLVVSDDLLHNY